MRLFRSGGFRSAFFPLVLLLLVVLAAPRPAAASWFAMLIQVGRQIQEAIDIAERHTRIIEDQLDRVAGLQNAYNDINTTYHTVRRTLSTLGIGERAPRLGDLYRAGIVDDACLRYDSLGSLATCQLRDAARGEFHRFVWNVRNLPTQLTGPQDFSTYERAIRDGWDGDFPVVAPGPVVDRVMEGVTGIDPTVPPADRLQTANLRGRAAFHGGRGRARRVAAAVDYGRRAAGQMLDQPGRVGTPVDDFGGCGSIADSGMTVLVAALRADCTPSSPLLADPRGGADGTANLSQTESRHISIQAQITETMIRASELEQALLAYEARLASQIEAADMARERQRRFRRRIDAATGAVAGCVTFAYAVECEAGDVVIESDAVRQARVDLLVNNF